MVTQLRKSHCHSGALVMNTYGSFTGTSQHYHQQDWQDEGGWARFTEATCRSQGQQAHAGLWVTGGCKAHTVLSSSSSLPALAPEYSVPCSRARNSATGSAIVLKWSAHIVLHGAELWLQAAGPRGALGILCIRRWVPQHSARRVGMAQSLLWSQITHERRCGHMDKD